MVPKARRRAQLKCVRETCPLQMLGLQRSSHLLYLARKQARNQDNCHTTRRGTISVVALSKKRAKTGLLLIIITISRFASR